ncbi:hypothetical protein MED121_13000 [Marinomonas sp. MED121]|nr:hypothetical protein MED121_13000 [Marinomonas sp. MED121]
MLLASDKEGSNTAENNAALTAFNGKLLGVVSVTLDALYILYFLLFSKIWTTKKARAIPKIN